MSGVSNNLFWLERVTKLFMTPRLPKKLTAKLFETFLKFATIPYGVLRPHLSDQNEF